MRHLKILALLLLISCLENMKVVTKKAMRIDVQGRDIESLLYCWLEKILLLLLVDEFIPSEFDANISMEKRQAFC